MEGSSLVSVLAVLSFLDARHALALGQGLPDLGRLQLAMGPEDEEMIEEIGGFRRQLLFLAPHSLDDRLDRLLAQFLGDLFRALGEEPGSVGAGRVRPLAAFDHLVEAVENTGVQRPGRILRHGLTPYISMIQCNGYNPLM